MATWGPRTGDSRVSISLLEKGMAFVNYQSLDDKLAIVRAR